MSIDGPLLVSNFLRSPRCQLGPRILRVLLTALCSDLNTVPTNPNARHVQMPCLLAVLWLRPFLQMLSSFLYFSRLLRAS